jgi:DNA-binding beta-propeller fold protein YncE
MDEFIRRFAQRTVALGLLLLVASVECAPRVVTGLNEVFQNSFATPPPSRQWAAIVDPKTLSTVTVLSSSGARAVAIDLHGHRAYLSSGGGVTVIDTSLNRVEAVIRSVPFDPISFLVTDPVRARLYATSDFGQPQIEVIDTGALAFLPPISLPPGLPVGGGVTRLAVAPDGTRLFVLVANVLLTMRLPDGQLLQSATLDFTPTSFALNQDLNELYVGDYGGRGVFVLAADSLIVERSLTGFGGISAVAVRPTDGALFVESAIDFDSELDAVDVVTGQRLAMHIGSGSGLVVSIDGKQVYRLQRGDLSLGGSYSETSSQLVVLDALSLNIIATIPLDTRAPNDPSRGGSAIVAISAASLPRVTATIEYFEAALGHYFTTSLPAEISALDAGRFPGWQRTGEKLPVYAQRDDGPDGSVPVCRFYGLPEKGLDSHFYSASAAECVQIQQRFGDSWLLESSEVFDVYSADIMTGACPFETTPVYRVYNNRPDANHRYTTSLAIRDSMVQNGWIPEGYGPNAVAFCVPR